MQFSSDKLVLVKRRSFRSAKGNDCSFVTLANPQTYESVDLMPVRGCNIDRFADGDVVTAILHYDGRYVNVDLMPAT